MLPLGSVRRPWLYLAAVLHRPRLSKSRQLPDPRGSLFTSAGGELAVTQLPGMFANVITTAQAVAS